MQRKAVLSQTVLHRDFLLVVAGQIISVFGNQIVRYALPLYLLNQTGSSALFGTVQAFSFVPMVLLYPIGGIIADRVNKRNIMVMLDGATAALIVLFALLAGTVDLVLLMGVTLLLLYGIQGAYQPAVKASVPLLVPPEQTMRANAIVDMVNSVASMAGPVIGGLLFSTLGLMPILHIAAGCFFASAVMELFIRIPFERREAAGGIWATGVADLKESFRFMFRDKPVLWQLSAVFALSNLMLTTLVLIGVPVIITQHLGFAQDVANRYYGYAQGVLAAGAVLGGLLAGVLSKRLRTKDGPALLIGCSLAVMLGGTALQLLQAPHAIVIALMLGCGLLLLLHTVFQIQMMTFVQLLTPRALIGKVVSCFMCVVMCTNPLGQLLYGFVFEIIGGRLYLPFYVAGAVMIAISLGVRGVFGRMDG